MPSSTHPRFAVLKDETNETLYRLKPVSHR